MSTQPVWRLGKRRVLIFGPPGSGKSGLALQLMALGCTLVSDDQTLLSVREGALIARAPDAIRGRIEARGVGLLTAECLPEAEVHLAVDLGQSETHRLPPDRTLALLGRDVALVHNFAGAHFPAAILQYLKGGRCA